MRYILVLLVLVCTNLIAQTDYRPGYLITNSMDTIKGLVDYRGELRNMKVCNFKKSPDSSPETFLPGEIYGYRYDVGKFYVSKDIDTDDFKGTVFVEFLLQGIVNLYFYHNPTYLSYFIEDEEGKMFEIRTKDIVIENNGTEYIRNDTKYIGLLRYLFHDCPQVVQLCDKVDLTHKGLINITKKYHDFVCSDQTCIEFEKKLPVLRVELKPVIGYSITKLKLDGDDLQDLKFDTSISPFAGLVANFLIPRMNEKWSFQLGATIHKDYFYGSRFTDNYGGYSILDVYEYYHIHNTNVSSFLSIKYLYPKGKYRPEIDVGLYKNFLIDHYVNLYTESKFTDYVISNYTKTSLLDDTQNGIRCGVGVEYTALNKFRMLTKFVLLKGGDNSGEIKSKVTSLRLAIGLTF